MNVGEYIKELRLAAGYSQDKLGQLLGVQRAAVQKWECGKVQNLKRETIKKMATIFNVSPSTFIIADNQSPQIVLTHHESKVITAYRSKPLVQPHVDKLLDVEPEKETTPSEGGVVLSVAARGVSVTDKEFDEYISEEDTMKKPKKTE